MSGNNTKIQNLEKAAREVLQNNDRGTHVIPSSGLYPHQWFWDSCFIAIGLRHINLDRAKTEINSILEGQWSNGMIPHMILAPQSPFSREGDIWRSWVNPHAPSGIHTSGITQPPVLAEAIQRIGESLPKNRTAHLVQASLPCVAGLPQVAV